jgi:DNA-binding transcriptional MocR family regulator
MVSKTPSDVEFLGAHLPGLPDFFNAAMHEAEGDLPPLVADHHYLPMGLPALRRAIAAYFEERGLPTSEEQVLVTSGAQQAIALVANVFVDPGKVVLMEDPTYLGAIDAFASFGARPTGLMVGPAGIRVDQLREAMARTAPRVVYLVATCHNPTGTVMPEEHRREIMRDVDRTSALLVEDMTLADFCLDGSPPRAIAAFARGDNVLTIGSMSKFFWGGLRVGWIRGPEALIARLAETKVVSDLGGSILGQAIAAKILDRADQLVRFRQRQARARRDLLARLLREHLPSWSWSKPAGGLSLWVRLPSGNASELAQVALRHGVAIVPGTVNSPEGQHGDCLRLPFVAEPEILKDGIERLSRAWKELCSTPQRTRRGVGVLV